MQGHRQGPGRSPGPPLHNIDANMIESKITATLSFSPPDGGNQIESNVKVAKKLDGFRQDDLGADYVEYRDEYIEAVTLPT